MRLAFRNVSVGLDLRITGRSRFDATEVPCQPVRSLQAYSPKPMLASRKLHSPLDIMRTARQRTATSRRARPRWPHSRSRGGERDSAEFPGCADPRGVTEPAGALFRSRP